MDIQAVQTPLTQFLQATSTVVRVQHLVVFGSYAAGKATRKSDIDVIVVSDDFQGMREDKRDQMLWRAAQGITPEIQPWGFTTKEFQTAGKLSTLGNAREAGYWLV